MDGEQSKPHDPAIQLKLLIKRLDSFQIPPKTVDTSPSLKNEKPLIESKPALQYISKAADILRSTKDAEGNILPHWTELSSEVKDFDSTLELSDKVRDVVRDYIAKKIPDLKSSIPTIANLEDGNLLNALTHNWFDSDLPEVEGQRREVLLTVMANIVKRMETKIYKDVVTNADEEGLKKLGIDGNLRDLLVDLLDVSMKVDPLFVRFLAFSRLSGKPGESATGTAFTLPEKEGESTLHQLFPKETQGLAKRFRDIANKSLLWSDKPGAEIFKKYLATLSDYYDSTDTTKSAQYQEELTELYGKTVEAGFPIVLTPSIEQYIKEPYYEPDLKVSLVVPENSGEDKEFKEAYKKMQKAMAGSLSELGMEEYTEKLDKDVVKVLIMLGGFGSNLIGNTVEQADPVTVLYLNEQIRSYDKDFPGFMDSLITNSSEIFKDKETSLKLREVMSRLETIMHGFSHPVIDYKSDNAKRMGDEPLTIIEEVKAEMVHKALIPAIIEKGGLEGTREQWALATLTSTCQLLRDMPEDNEYFYAASYTLNSLFKSGAIVFENDKLTVNDFNLFYAQLKSKAVEVLNLYQDSLMNKDKAEEWIKQECEPNESVKKLNSFLKAD